MKTPFITIHLEKLEHNVKTIATLCNQHGVQVTGVTKGTLAIPEVAKAMIRGGATWLGDSRLDNIERLKNAGLKEPCLLMRSPHLSELHRVIDLVDVSLNTELEVIRGLSEVALQKGKVHQIILMVDLGDLREGVWPSDVADMVKEIIPLQGVQLVGLGANLTDLNGVLPTVENNQQLVDLAEEIEKMFSIHFDILSVGNSSSLKLLESGLLPKRINHFRIGECLLLGRETADGEQWPNTYYDAFTLTAEVVETKLKPSMPIGEIGKDAFGNTPVFQDCGMMNRTILNIGRQDVVPEALIPHARAYQILGTTSDHMIVDTTKGPALKVGDYVHFDMNYSALLATMTSPFVHKICSK